MKQNFLILGILSSLLFSACSTAQPMWRKAGVTPFDMQNTLAKCRYDIGIAKVTQQEKIEMTRDCMISQGYRYS